LPLAILSTISPHDFRRDVWNLPFPTTRLNVQTKCQSAIELLTVTMLVANVQGANVTVIGNDENTNVLIKTLLQILVVLAEFTMNVPLVGSNVLSYSLNTTVSSRPRQEFLLCRDTLVIFLFDNTCYRSCQLWQSWTVETSGCLH
jgi:hypothetical protein